MGVRVRNASLLWSDAALALLPCQPPVFGLGHLGAGDGGALATGGAPGVAAGEGTLAGAGAGVPCGWLIIFGVPTSSSGAEFHGEFMECCIALAV